MLRKLIARIVAPFPTVMLRLTYAAHSKGQRPLTEIQEQQLFIKQHVDNLLRWDIDGWEIRQIMNNLAGADMVPDPKIIDAALRACRQVNDIALAIRWLETCKNKCGDDVNIIYPYLLSELRPTLTELGIPTLEELNYHKPQLALESVYDM